MKRFAQRLWSDVSELWPIYLFLGVLFAACIACLGWGAYEIHFKEKWAKDAQSARYNAYLEEKKQELLTEVSEFVAGKRPLTALSKSAQEMLAGAVAKVRPDWRDDRKPRVTIYPEIFEIVPALRGRDLTFDKEALPSVEEYQRRVAAFIETYRGIYGKERDHSEISYEEYLRIDHRDLRWINTMGNRLNDSAVAKAGEVSKRLPVVKDAVLAVRLVEVYGSGQHAYAANCKGFNPVERHTEFSDALVQVLVVGGHDYFVPDGKFGNGILLPPLHDEKPGNTVHQWGAVYNPRVRGRGLSFSACSVEPTVLTDLTGRIVAIQVGKEALRVTFYDDKGSPEKLTPTLVKLAELLGVKPRKIDAKWTRVDETTTWELKLGA